MAGMAAGALVPAHTLTAGADDAVYLSSAQSRGGNEARLFSLDGDLRGALALPDRGHGGAMHPRRPEAVIFARRPGTFALVLDRRDARLAHRIDAGHGRHFYGHGAFAPDGRLLYASENDYDGARGVIGIYDAERAYARTGEIDSHGVGPHDVHVAADGVTLIIANGGIATHPETGRRKLNVADMAPSLSFVDARSGAKLREAALPRELHKLSIRHLALAADGAVFAAMQYEGPGEDRVPLVARFAGGALEPLDAPEPVLARMRNYCGSVALDASARVAAVSGPRGGLVTFWSCEGAYLSSVEIDDGCGIAATGAEHQFVLSSGAGERLLVDLAAGTRRIIDRDPATQWDNHITRG